MRMLATFLMGLAMMATTGGDRTWAEDNAKLKKTADDTAVANALDQLVQLGAGVHKIKTNDQGRIQSVVVVGQSRISTALGQAKGLEIARTRAQLAARGEFVKWLKEKVRVRVQTDDETILLLEGSEGKGVEALKESGKAIEKTSQQMETVAEGLVRGLEVLHTEVNAKEQTYTVILGWAAKTADAAQAVPTGQNTKSPDKKLDTKKATSSSAKKFLED